MTRPFPPRTHWASVPLGTLQREPARRRSVAWWVEPGVVEPPEGFQVIVDTGEQLPFFEGERWAVRRTLKRKVGDRVVGHGDYSLVGHEEEVAVERKSLEDLFGSATAGRERLEREMEALSLYAAPALVVEGSWAQIADPGELVHSRANPDAILASCLSWARRYKIMILAAGSRRLAERLTFRWLAGFYRDQHPEADRRVSVRVED